MQKATIFIYIQNKLNQLLMTFISVYLFVTSFFHEKPFILGTRTGSTKEMFVYQKTLSSFIND